MENFTVGEGAVSVEALVHAREALGFLDAAQETDAVGLEQRLKEIGTAMLEHGLDLIVAGIVPEALIEQVDFLKFDGGTLIADHKLLET